MKIAHWWSLCDTVSVSLKFPRRRSTLCVFHDIVMDSMRKGRHHHQTCRLPTFVLSTFFLKGLKRALLRPGLAILTVCWVVANVTILLPDQLTSRNIHHHITFLLCKLLNWCKIEDQSFILSPLTRVHFLSSWFFKRPIACWWFVWNDKWFLLCK